MKKIIKYLGCAVALAAMTCGQAMARGEVTKVYMFGFAASFNDSIVHFTDIQQVDSAWVETKSQFLLLRENYSYQLRDYLAEQQNMAHRTCMVTFNTNRAKLEKEYQKMKRLYTEKAKGAYDVRYLTSSDFLFRAVDASDQMESQPPLTKEEKKAQKQQAKETKKKAKQEQKKAKKERKARKQQAKQQQKERKAKKAEKPQE